MVPLRPGQCILYTDRGLFKVAEQGGAPTFWLDNLYVRTESGGEAVWQQEPNPASNWTLWLSRLTLQDTGASEPVDGEQDRGYLALYGRTDVLVQGACVENISLGACCEAAHSTARCRVSDVAVSATQVGALHGFWQRRLPLGVIASQHASQKASCEIRAVVIESAIVAAGTTSSIALCHAECDFVGSAITRSVGLGLSTASFENCAFSDFEATENAITCFTGRLRVANTTFENVTTTYGGTGEEGAWIGAGDGVPLYTDVDAAGNPEVIETGNGGVSPLSAGAGVSWLTEASPELLQLRQVRGVQDTF